MIYSLVGLSSARRDTRFVVDYSKLVCQVYADIVEYILATTRKLDIICAIPRGLNPHKLPSRVPDWSFHGLGSSLVHSSKHQYSAAGASEAEAYISTDKANLHAVGVSLGPIRVAGVPCGMDDMEDEKHAVATFHAWQKLITTTTGLMGLAPEKIRITDILSILLGCQFPTILRPHGIQYSYLGEAFVEGYMYGEVMYELKKGDRELKNFGIR